MTKIEQAKKNLSWIINQLENADLEIKKDLESQGIFLDGEIGYVFHLKRVLELLEDIDFEKK